MAQTVQLDIPDDMILSRKDAGLMSLTLNRPEAMNALSIEMIRILSGRMGYAASNPDIRMICINSSDQRAFCAGGDVKQATALGMQARKGDIDMGVAMLFFEEEYGLNAVMAGLEKPVVSIAGGICMGGGFGLAGNGSHIIVDETTRFAMPEVRIGFFTDVGSARILAGLPYAYGYYLALTGKTIDAADMLEAGLAQAYIPQSRNQRLHPALIDLSRGACQAADVDACLASFDDKDGLGESALRQNREAIEHCFSQPRLQDIIAALEEQDSAWAGEALAEIRAACPISLAVTFRHLNESKGQDAGAVLERDTRLARQIFAKPAFLRGCTGKGD